MTLQELFSKLSENTPSELDRILATYPKEVENFKQGGDLDYDLENALWDYYFNQGYIKNYNADASEWIAQQLADELGLDEGITGGVVGAVAGAYLGKGNPNAIVTGYKLGSGAEDLFHNDNKDSDVVEGDHNNHEYDHEGEFTKDQLRTIIRSANKLGNIIDDNSNMPEWVQMKITKAEDYVDTAADYMDSQDMPVDEEKIGGRHDPEEFDAMVARLRKLAGYGPMKTVWDPVKRVYKNVPVSKQPGDKR